MLLRKANLFLLATLVIAGIDLAQGQISGGLNFPCSDDEVDAVAVCVSHIVCTQPPDPLAAFDIGARAFATCPNQPVDNFASVDAKVGGVQAIATAQARALFFNRLIHKEIRGGDCSGNAPLLSLVDDPQGCNPPPPPPPPPTDPCLNSVSVGPTGSFTSGGGGDDAPDCSPIIVDTTGKGFHLTSAADGVLFDIAGTGNPIRIGWTAAGSGNAFLALPDSGGVVKNGTQLFGNFTPQPPSPRPNGFLALAVYDKPNHGGNNDGVIDQNDQIFSSLRLWVDENHDGICQSEELHKLPDMGVLSIDLTYSLSHRVDQFGNIFRYRADINPGISGKSTVDRKAFDVFFTRNEHTYQSVTLEPILGGAHPR